MNSEGYVIQKDNQGRYNVTIPKALVLALGIKKGQITNWSIKENKLVLTIK